MTRLNPHDASGLDLERITAGYPPKVPGRDYCSCFPDRIAGVDLSEGCYLHDAMEDAIKKGRARFSRRWTARWLACWAYRRFVEAGRPKMGRIVAGIVYQGLTRLGWAYRLGKRVGVFGGGG